MRPHAPQARLHGALKLLSKCPCDVGRHGRAGTACQAATTDEQPQDPPRLFPGKETATIREAWSLLMRWSNQRARARRHRDSVLSTASKVPRPPQCHIVVHMSVVIACRRLAPPSIHKAHVAAEAPHSKSSMQMHIAICHMRASGSLLLWGCL